SGRRAFSTPYTLHPKPYTHSRSPRTQQPIEVVGIEGGGFRGLARDGSRPIEIDESPVHGHHPLLSARLEDRVELLGSALADEVAHGGAGDHDLHRRNAATALARQKLLRENGF